LREIEAVDAERIDAGNALRAVGDVHRPRQVVEENAHDLAEAEGDDGQVVAAQLERRRPSSRPKNAASAAPIGTITQKGR